MAKRKTIPTKRRAKSHLTWLSVLQFNPFEIMILFYIFVSIIKVLNTIILGFCLSMFRSIFLCSVVEVWDANSWLFSVFPSIPSQCPGNFLTVIITAILMIGYMPSQTSHSLFMKSEFQLWNSHYIAYLHLSLYLFLFFLLFYCISVYVLKI